MDNTDVAKEAAAKEALKYARSGYVIGVGTGSTAMVFLRELHRLIINGVINNVLLVPTSTETEIEIVRLGLANLLRYPWQVDRIDVAVDSADEVDRRKNLIKGGGAALTREKIIDYWAREFIVIIDESKVFDSIPSKHPIPIEVIPFAWSIVKARLEELGGTAELRFGSGKRGPVVTDNGNYIIDYMPRAVVNIEDLERTIKELPGVVEVGIFNGRRVSRVIIGKADGSVITMD
ncbi:ribose-5-phosphate isomerase RpiA [Vulcanisaeta distributa]|uniref:Ribose-5-phosphate isomerase A n=1 Tax=Vulcanisaeta distributa (strain DSM 14429 / JCM 11212 / NBRC 100878 / IC-017) TaxID=572478 RepID=E1QRN8_VULDI|nr:ribose-5-phosphate isomerase RpiA [Vulcanisaeta distributa]ADN51852.1 ribose 5-phosphate isomerase [Vulcanisaeta distributa DSM 14429]